jgi:hypothetical protein
MAWYAQGQPLIMPWGKDHFCVGMNMSMSRLFQGTDIKKVKQNVVS